MFLTDLLVIALVFVVVAIFLAAYTRRVADVLLTEHFRAAEAISEGKAPEAWITQINRQLVYRRWLPGRRKVEPGTKLALEKLARLRLFFAKSKFFETAQARELLLAKMDETRDRWEKMTWDEIVKSA